MLEKKTKYDVTRHVKELLDFVGTVIDEEAIKNNSETANLAWRDVMEASLHSLLSTVLNVPDAVRETAKDCCELERTGVIAFRY